MNNKLKPEEKKTLLMIARDAITAHVNGQKPKQLDEYPLSPHAFGRWCQFRDSHQKRQAAGGMHRHPASRAKSGRRCAIARDSGGHGRPPRFPAVQASELAQIKIEISRLTPPPVKLDYENPQDLAQLIRPPIKTALS